MYYYPKFKEHLMATLKVLAIIVVIVLLAIKIYS